MTFFSNTINNQELKIKDIYLITTSIVPNFDNRHSCKLRVVTMYFLANYHNNEYYELFSNIKIEKKEQQKDDCSFSNTDIPLIEKTEPLEKYLTNLYSETINIESLFHFITKMNTLNLLGVLDAYAQNTKKHKEDEKC